MPQVVNFYRVSDEYGCFSNFAPFPIVIESEVWPTSEHYFQAQKFADPERRQRIRQAKSPMIAARLGRSRETPIRPDWESVKLAVMRTAVRAKFIQHESARRALLATGEATIVEHTPNDSYWGDGGDGSGQNMLGRMLMEIRDELRQRALNAPSSGLAEPVEVSAGAVVVRGRGDQRQALLVRTRKAGYEIPKGHLEAGEDARQAALRELREETGLLSAVNIAGEIGTLEYRFQRDGVPVAKRVHYFMAFLAEDSPGLFAALPEGTQELRWVARRELDSLPLVHEDLRAIIARALEASSEV
jgi:ribA/ribD-fused uncharacterized protein